MAKYTVVQVDGMAAVEVEADSPDDAFEKSKEAFMGADLSKTDVVNCYDEGGNIVKDY